VKRFFWPGLLFGVSALACVTENGQLRPAFLSPEAQPSALPGGDPDKCRAGDRGECQKLAVREVELWQQDPGAVSKVSSGHLAELAEATANACSTWSAWSDEACLASRRVALEHMLRHAEATAGDVTGVVSHIRAARSHLDGAHYDINVAEAEAKQALVVARAASIRAKVAEAKRLVDSAHLPGTRGFDEDFFNIETALQKNDFDTADQEADEVLQQARAVVAAREQADAQQRAADVTAARLADQRARLQNQAPAVQAATAACDANPSACKTKCDGAGDGPSCFAWATRLWKKTAPPKLADARTTMQRGCDSGTQAACDALLYIDTDIQTAENNAREADQLWNSSGGVADVALAMLGGGMGFNPSSRRFVFHRLQPGSGEWKAVADQCYCPAKAAFVIKASVAEFARRASQFCNTPPVDHPFDVATCRSLFATPCANGTPTRREWVATCP
jgi:hypothetical protein